MINSVVLMGRLVADPELRTTTTGREVCTFRIAVDRNFVSQGQDRQADFITCVAWGSTANFINRFFSKGSMIALTGRIQTRNYEDRDGNKRTAFEVVVNEASFTGSKSETGTREAAPAQAPQPEQAAYSTAAPSDFEIISDDEDLPF